MHTVNASQTQWRHRQLWSSRTNLFLGTSARMFSISLSEMPFGTFPRSITPASFWVRLRVSLGSKYQVSSLVELSIRFTTWNNRLSLLSDSASGFFGVTRRAVWYGNGLASVGALWKKAIYRRRLFELELNIIWSLQYLHQHRHRSTWKYLERTSGWSWDDREGSYCAMCYTVKGAGLMTCRVRQNIVCSIYWAE